MALGVSLHIGLNSVDPIHYDGWDGRLAACEADAKDMAAIAKKTGFSDTKLLLTTQATAVVVTQTIKTVARQLKKGDLFLLTYAGHGGQVPDTNFDEADRKDETWVLYDRQLVDDELHQLYAMFKSGVRILVLSDSCHSGTVTRAMPPWEAGQPAVRAMPNSVGDATYRRNRATYDKIQTDNAGAESKKVKATVLLISGCQDNQVASDGSRNGLFTEKMKKVWSNGSFKYGYRRFRDTIVSKMPPTQTPNYSVIVPPIPRLKAKSPLRCR